MSLLDEPRPGTPVPGSGCKKRAARKETRELLAHIEAAGGEVRPHQGRPGHFKVYVDGVYIGGIAGTPSDRRAMANDIARLRRAGLKIDSKGRYHG
ncbi:HicA-like toxin [Mycobacterium phage CRB2]|uniref:HicA-like toxin n=1 Tax=Mycobacterium phage CRB2 TaxID=2483623 RepID=A0A455LYB0_9CAUD|nr:HicA-like toxin [Mycobacterium phage CRB2]AYP70068.1 HicA-like toxin [Mycobacterium phage CRB2]